MKQVGVAADSVAILTRPSLSLAQIPPRIVLFFSSHALGSSRRSPHAGRSDASSDLRWDLREAVVRLPVSGCIPQSLQRALGECGSCCGDHRVGRTKLSEAPTPNLSLLIAVPVSSFLWLSGLTRRRVKSSRSSAIAVPSGLDCSIARKYEEGYFSLLMMKRRPTYDGSQICATSSALLYRCFAATAAVVGVADRNTLLLLPSWQP